MAFLNLVKYGALTACLSITAVQAEDASFNQYVEGALVVYSKFKEPSKQESEQFYAFIKSKWDAQKCSYECSEDGLRAGQEYAYQRRIELEPSS